MKRNFSLVSLFIGIVFLVTLFAGCGNAATENTASADQTSAAQQQTTAAKAEEPAALKLVMFERWAGVTYDNFSMKYIEEKTNTKLDITAIESKELESKLNILLASGDRPDFIQFGNDDTELKYKDSGLLLPISDYFNKAPNLENYGADGIWDAMRHKDGKVYAIPIKGSHVDNIPIYRKDWLDKLGFKVPATIDEYYAVAEAFTNNDPDGNGVKDTYALGGHISGDGLNMNMYDLVIGAFGIVDDFMEIDGKITHGAIQPGMKDALKFLNKMYRAKLIDPEFVTDNEARFKEKVIKGVIGSGTYRYFLMDTSNISNYYKPFKDNNPNAEMIEGGLLKGPAEKNPGVRSLSKRGWLKTAVTKESKNIDAAIRLLDWLTSDEGVMFVEYGIENEHYTKQDGVVKSKLDDAKMKELGITQMLLARNTQYQHASKRFQELLKYAQSMGAPVVTDGLFTSEASKVSELRKFTVSQYVKMITADGDIDAMFDEFVKEWNKRDGEVILGAFNKARN